MLDSDILRLAASANTGYLHSFGREATVALVQLLELHDGENLLELGCGTGYTTMYVLACKDVLVQATEAKPEMLAAAQKNAETFGMLQRCKFHATKHGTPLPFPDQSFDKVYWEGVLALQATGDFDFFLSEVYRVLKKGGRCVMNETIWLKGVSQELIDDWNSYNEKNVNLRGSTQLSWNADDWMAHFTKAGFDVLNSQLIGEAIKQLNRGIQPGWMFKTRLAFARWASRGRKVVSPVHALSNWRLKRKLKRFKNIPQVLEARFFVLKKP